MTGAQKTAAAKKAAPKVAAKKAAAPKVQPAPKVARLDLTDALALGGKPPVPVTFQGVDAEVRREYTGAEVVDFYEALQDSRIGDVIKMIVGADTADALWEKVAALPPGPATVVVNRLVNLSELAEGEVVAPLPALLGMDGAQPSQDSAGTTG
ncbi:hypothetical protein [Tomitella gaofuii]|uniref:hypothetical protein n=1 Tax=Tomitella gaofuii TaxID=2760083 RepID=UPI0015FA16E1|nr:hypothetical protein [Tomitella gaofuii]